MTPGGYTRLPAEADAEPRAGSAVAFAIFAVLVIGAATVAGLVKSGKLDLNKFFNVPKPAAQRQPAVPAPAHTAAARPPAAAAAPLKPGAFVVTSISIGQPSFAIINGRSRSEGDALEAPGVTGWSVARITEEAVLVRNGSTYASLPLSTPDMKPLDDSLKPLN
jgi:hypothetical protein